MVKRLFTVMVTMSVLFLIIQCNYSDYDTDSNTGCTSNRPCQSNYSSRQLSYGYEESVSYIAVGMVGLFFIICAIAFFVYSTISMKKEIKLRQIEYMKRKKINQKRRDQDLNKQQQQMELGEIEKND